MKQQDEVAKLESHFGDLALKYQQQGLKDIDLTEQLEKGKAEIRKKFRKIELDEQTEKAQELYDLELTYTQLSVQNMEDGSIKQDALAEIAKNKEDDRYREALQTLNEQLENKVIVAEEYRRITETLEGIHQEKLNEIEKEGVEKRTSLEKSRLDSIKTLVGDYASLYRDMAQAGIGGLKESFDLYKAFAGAEGIIAAYGAYLKGLEKGGPVMAYANLALGLAKVALINAQQPPSFDQGGISTKPGVYYSGVPEAHIPLKSGKVPVDISGGERPTIINEFHIEGNTFLDQQTLQENMAVIADTISKQNAPGAIVENYLNDGIVRTILGGR